MYQNYSKRKRDLKLEDDWLDHQNNLSQKIPSSFDFSTNTRGVPMPGFSAKPFYKCTVCDAELSSMKTVSDHLNGRRHTKMKKKRDRDIKYGIISADDVIPQVIIEVPVYQFGRIKIPAGPAAWATGARDQVITQAPKRRRFG